MNTTARKNGTIVETTATEKAPPALMGNAEFTELLQSAIGLSPLAVGEKFSTDDLIAAESVTLWAFDWVDYVENEGTADEKNVHFALWKTIIEVKEKSGETVAIEGYYQGGAILNKIAQAIADNNAYTELGTYGIKIRVEWGKTSGKNPIALITVL